MIVGVIGWMSGGRFGVGGGPIGRVTSYFLKKTYENHTAQRENHRLNLPLQSAHSLPAPSSKNKCLYPPSLFPCCRQKSSHRQRDQMFQRAYR